MHFYSLHFYPDTSCASPNQKVVVLTRMYAMKILTSTLLASLSLTVFTINYSRVGYTAEAQYGSDLVQQQLIAQEGKDGKDCIPSDGQSPTPGCGRTNYWSFHQA